MGPLGIHNECAKDPQREQPGTLNHNLEESHLPNMAPTLDGTKNKSYNVLNHC